MLSCVICIIRIWYHRSTPNCIPPTPQQKSSSFVSSGSVRTAPFILYWVYVGNDLLWHLYTFVSLSLLDFVFFLTNEFLASCCYLYQESYCGMTQGRSSPCQIPYRCRCWKVTNAQQVFFIYNRNHIVKWHTVGRSSSNSLSLSLFFKKKKKTKSNSGWFFLFITDIILWNDTGSVGPSSIALSLSLSLLKNTKSNKFAAFFLFITGLILWNDTGSVGPSSIGKTNV